MKLVSITGKYKIERIDFRAKNYQIIIGPFDKSLAPSNNNNNNQFVSENPVMTACNSRY